MRNKLLAALLALLGAASSAAGSGNASFDPRVVVKGAFQVAVHAGTRGLSSVAHAIGAGITDALDGSN